MVHGCFWHGHDCARGARQPTTNAAYWQAKIARNRARDGTTIIALAEAGWKTVTIWECETREAHALAKLIKKRMRLGGIGKGIGRRA